MKHYLAPDDTLHGIDGGRSVPADWVEITIEQARAHGQPPELVKTTLELDIEKYLRRANAKPLLMAEMAAMNIGRLKDRTWTTQQLVGLMADPDIVKLIAHMETLSFELAIGVINGITNELVTPAIKATWISRLQAHLY